MKKLSRKGFTLVELIAVIVILAVIILIATNAVGGQMNNAKKMALAVEANQLVGKAQQAFETERYTKASEIGAKREACYSMKYLIDNGFYEKKSADLYSGSVHISIDDTGLKYTYRVWISNTAFSIVDVTGEATADNVVTSYGDSTEAAINSCGSMTAGTNLYMPTNSTT